MSVVSPSEWEDFKALLSAHGFSESDFDVKEVEDGPSTVEPSPNRGTLTITRKQNALSRTYRVGHMSEWLSDFEDDLIGGAFGAR